MRLNGSLEELGIHQFANDWITLDYDGDPDAKPQIVSPLRCRLNKREVAEMRLDEARFFLEPQGHHAGTFWNEWVLSDLGYFRVRRPDELGKADAR